MLQRFRRDSIDVSGLQAMLHLAGRFDSVDRRADADVNLFFTRELAYISAEYMERLYAELKARTFIPVSHEIDPGAKTYVFHQYDKVGAAKIITDYASDAPRVDVFGNEYIVPVREIADSFAYSLKEILAAAKVNRPLTAMRAMAARRAMEEKLDTIATFGDSASGLPGFLVNPNVLTYNTPATGAGSSTTFASKTPDQILLDLNTLASLPAVSTQDVEHADTLLLPITQYKYIANTPRASFSDKTILEFFLENNDDITEVASWYQLAGAGSGSTDRMVAYKRDPEKVRLQIPMEMQQLPPQPENFAFKVNAWMATAGTVFYYPSSQAYADGI
jgi:hypothetical protein